MSRAQRARAAGALLALAALLAPAEARADDDELWSVLVGPVLGIRMEGAKGAVLGVEGGVGVFPVRVNVGIQRRLAGPREDDPRPETFLYAEVDPWFIIGGTLGLGAGSVTGGQPVVGLWEGITRGPGLDDCQDGGFVYTLSVGYRYSGIHELYVAPKVGHITQGICIH